MIGREILRQTFNCAAQRQQLFPNGQIGGSWLFALQPPLAQPLLVLRWQFFEGGFDFSYRAHGANCNPQTPDHSSRFQACFFKPAARQPRLRTAIRRARTQARQAQRRRIDKVDVTPDQFPEGGVRAVHRVFSEQLLAVYHRVFTSKAPPKLKTEQNILEIVKAMGRCC